MNKMLLLMLLSIPLSFSAKASSYESIIDGEHFHLYKATEDLYTRFTGGCDLYYAIDVNWVNNPDYVSKAEHRALERIGIPAHTSDINYGEVLNILAVLVLVDGREQFILKKVDGSIVLANNTCLYNATKSDFLAVRVAPATHFGTFRYGDSKKHILSMLEQAPATVIKRGLKLFNSEQLDVIEVTQSSLFPSIQLTSGESRAISHAQLVFYKGKFHAARVTYPIRDDAEIPQYNQVLFDSFSEKYYSLNRYLTSVNSYYSLYDMGTSCPTDEPCRFSITTEKNQDGGFLIHMFGSSNGDPTEIDSEFAKVYFSAYKKWKNTAQTW